MDVGHILMTKVLYSWSRSCTRPRIS